MPVYIHLANLILRKEAIAKRYPGGVSQFRIDFKIDEIETRQEDDELFLIAQMNTDDFYLDELVARGLHYDVQRNFSSDFTMLGRYDSNFEWETNWLEHNGVYAWHKDADTEVIARARCFDWISMNQIAEGFDGGENPFAVIRKGKPSFIDKFYALGNSTLNNNE